MIILTRKEAKVKGLNKYFTGRPCKHGHIASRRTSGGQCVECDKLERQRNQKIRTDRYNKAHKTERKEYQREWYHNNKESAKKSVAKYRANNKDKVVLLQKICHARWKKQNPEYYLNWWKENKEKSKQYRQMAYTKAAQKTWRENNKGYFNYHSRKRQKQIKLATPLWANQDKIKELYLESAKLKEETGIKYHVDHVIPLQGEAVCGLHIETNLKIITADENLKKGNKY